MKISSNIKRHIFQKDKLVFEFLDTGDIYRINYENNQINLLRGNYIDGQASNIYLRLQEGKKYKYQPLLGLNSKSRFKFLDDKVVYRGNAFGLEYQVTLTLFKDRFYYDVLVIKNDLNIKFDLVYGLDLAIASVGSIVSSESYTAQYTDHAVYKNEKGYVIQSRQNQGDPQFFQLGSLNKTVGYATDGFDVFTKDYRVTNEIEGLKKDLVNRKYQYEFPYITIQSELMETNKDNVVTFYGYYEPLHEKIEHEEVKITHNHKVVNTLIDNIDFKESKKLNYDLVNVLDFTEKEIKQMYSNIRHEEYLKKKELLAFFSDNHSHIVTRKKEVLVERQHGHLLISGNLLSGTENNLATTNWMFGVFSSHIVLGNTNIQKFTNDLRNPLNVQKISGMRIYLEKDNTYHLLATPSIYEMGVNYTKWLYKLEDDLIEVIIHVKVDAFKQRLQLKSKNNKKYNFIITNQLAMGDAEYQREITSTIKDNSIIFDFECNGFVKERYPNLKYRFKTNTQTEFNDDSLLFDESLGQGLLTMKIANMDSFILDLDATFDEFKDENLDFTKDLVEYNKFIDDIAGISIEHKKEQKDVEQISDTIFWYTHNALVHFASPHGLEQSNGAAWGTRDVLQGPVELFASAQKYDLVKMIIKKVFSRQFVENYDFPQWFMFDKYAFIQAHESHGDIIVWPLKALGDYIAATGDKEILNEKVPFMSMKTGEVVNEESTLLLHVDKTLNAIMNSFIEGTSLPAYGGGDWDDTLQPANKKLTDHMVSGWTPVLLYQALDTLSKELEGMPLGRRAYQLKERIKEDYFKYILKDNVPAGFVVFEQDQVEYLLHPRDENTGLNYRLLPLTRSIISQMISKEQAYYHDELIDKNLKHPDGVRLMDQLVTYRGGQKTYFQRAETAANFGREIGIMYVHAHIRYIEAMAKLGYSDKAYEALFKINPINIAKNVKNAQIRQSNMYFSSSDAAFLDRYEAKKDFNKVKTGKIDVKGGWRLYSSGPGIYINQLISNVLGIRIKNKNLVLDPVLPDKLKGIKINYHYFKKELVLEYKHSKEITKVLVNGKDFTNLVLLNNDNIYRDGGIVLSKSILDKESDKIEIVLM